MKNVSSSCSENVEKRELLIAVTAFLIFKQLKRKGIYNIIYVRFNQVVYYSRVIIY